MLSVYIACLLFGGILLAVSFIMGGGHDASTDVHGSLDIHSDTDIHASLSSGGGIDTHADIGHTGEVSSHALESQQQDGDSGDAVKFISLRNIIFFIAFFGLTGTALELLSVSGIITLLFSIVMGAFSAVTGYKFMKYLKSSESGEAINIYSLQGRTGKVIMNLSKEKQGKILIDAGNQSIEMRSLLAENTLEDELKYGDKVIIIEVKNNIAIVIKSEL